MARRPKTAIESELSGKKIMHVVQLSGADIPNAPLEGIPVCPKKTTKQGKIFWDEMIPTLYEMKVISKSDEPAMYALLKAYEDLIRAISDNEDFLKSHTTADENYIDQRLKYQKAYNNAEDTFNKLMTKFGMTPVDRNNLPITPKKEEEKDPLELLLGE